MIERMKVLFKDMLEGYSKKDIFMEVTVDTKGFLHIRKGIYEEVSKKLMDLGIAEYHFDEKFMGGFSKMIGGIESSDEYIQPAYFSLYDFYRIDENGDIVPNSSFSVDIALYEACKELGFLVHSN